MASYVQDPLTGKLIRKEEYHRSTVADSAAVHGDINAFISPIDGTLIDDRAKLRRHNERHHVTDSRDYSMEYYRSKCRERQTLLNCNSTTQKLERIEALNRTYEQLSR